MNKHTRSIIGIIALLAFSPFSVADDHPQIDGIKQYDRFSLLDIPSATVFGKAASSKKFMQFNALGQDFNLELEVNDRLSQDRIQWIGDEGKTLSEGVSTHYKGKLKGEDSSWVRITLRDGVIEGMIRHKGELYVVEPAKNHLEARSGMLMYRLSESETGLPPGTCALENPVVSKQMDQFTPALSQNIDFPALLSELNVTASATVSKELSLGVVLDHEFFQKHGDNSANLVQTLINQIDGIYEEELGVSIRIGKIAVFTTPNDPFTDATDASALLGELRQLVASADNPVAGAGLTHLFTGKDLDGSTAGIAFVGTLCRSDAAVGLSSDFIDTNRIMVLLTAHEVGHNFNAPHDNQDGSACASTPFGFIMNPFLSNSLEFNFSDCSLAQINPVVSRVSCLTPVANLFDLSIADILVPVVEGQNFTYDLETTNSGTESDFVLTGTLSPGLTFVSGDPDDGECTSSNQGFACTLKIPPETRAVTLITVTAATAGTQTLSADLTSASGALASASKSTLISAAPAPIDVAVSASVSSAAKVRMPLTYTFQVKNNSDVTANAVTLVDQLSISLDFVSANTTQGTCSSLAQTVTCPLGALTPGRQVSVTIETSPTAAINVINTVQVSSREDDANTANNTATTTTSVAAADDDGGDDGDGGNGALTGAWVLSFLLVFLLRLRRSKQDYVG